MAQLVKNPPVVRETRVWSLDWKDPLEKGKATHSGILARSVESQRVGHNWVTFTFSLLICVVFWRFSTWDDTRIQPLSSISCDGGHFLFPFYQIHLGKWLHLLAYPLPSLGKFFHFSRFFEFGRSTVLFFFCPATLATPFKTVPVSVAFLWGRIVNILRVKPYVYSGHPSFW